MTARTTSSMSSTARWVLHWSSPIPGTWFSSGTTAMQGAPSTFRPDDRESYRHGLAVTAWRLGTKNQVPYLYTLMLTAPQPRWPELQPVFEHAVSSFRLLPPTKKFITPEADPWLFF